MVIKECLLILLVTKLKAKSIVIRKTKIKTTISVHSVFKDSSVL